MTKRHQTSPRRHRFLVQVTERSLKVPSFSRGIGPPRGAAQVHLFWAVWTIFRPTWQKTRVTHLRTYYLQNCKCIICGRSPNFLYGYIYIHIYIYIHMVYIGMNIPIFIWNIPIYQKKIWHGLFFWTMSRRSPGVQKRSSRMRCAWDLSSVGHA